MTINWNPLVPDTEFFLPFIQGMADRMGFSFFKYGRMADAYPARVDAIASLKKRLEKYEADGNTEWLMDVANFAMIEFRHPRHPEAHLRPTDRASTQADSGRGKLTPPRGPIRQIAGRAVGLAKGSCQNRKSAAMVLRILILLVPIVVVAGVSGALTALLVARWILNLKGGE